MVSSSSSSYVLCIPILPAVKWIKLSFTIMVIVCRCAKQLTIASYDSQWPFVSLQPSPSALWSVFHLVPSSRCWACDESRKLFYFGRDSGWAQIHSVFDCILADVLPMAASNCGRDRIEMKNWSACVCESMAKSVHHLQRRMRQMFATEINHYILILFHLLNMYAQHISTHKSAFECASHTRYCATSRLCQRKIQRVMCNSFERDTRTRQSGTQESGRANKRNGIFNRTIEANTNFVRVCVWACVCMQWKRKLRKRQKRSDWGWTTQFVYFTRDYKKAHSHTNTRRADESTGEIPNDNEIPWHWLMSRHRELLE